MERHLLEQLERLVAPGDDEGPPELGRVRARLAAILAEGLEGESCEASRESGDDLAQLASYLDGRLNRPERETFLFSLANTPERRADVASAVALLSAIEADRQEPPPPELLARARSVFATEPVAGATRTRWIHSFGMRPVAWAGAALLAVVLVPATFIAITERGGSPSRPEPPPANIEGTAAPRPEHPIAPPLPTPETTLRSLHSRSGPLEDEPDAVLDRERAGLAADSPCDPSMPPAAATSVDSASKLPEPPKSSAVHCPGTVDALRRSPARAKVDEGSRIPHPVAPAAAPAASRPAR